MYIRTKDGIYDTNGLNLNKIIGNIKYEIIDNILFKTMYGYEEHLYEYEIIAQSDNLADLCDEFVRISHHQYTHRVINSSLYYLKNLHEYEDDKIEIYGCIWIEKGLIYVAKMNDKGELELI